MLVIGMLLKHGGMLALAVPPILYSCLCVISTLRLSLPILNIRRTVSRHRIIEGEEVEIAVDVSFEFGNIGRHFISVIDHLPARAQLIEGENQFLGPLLRGQSVRFSYCAVLPRGEARVLGSRCHGMVTMGIGQPHGIDTS